MWPGNLDAKSSWFASAVILKLASSLCAASDEKLPCFNWDPGGESEVRSGVARTIVSRMPSYNGIDIDPEGAGPLAAGNVFGIIDDTDAGNAGATGVRFSRDV